MGPAAKRGKRNRLFCAVLALLFFAVLALPYPLWVMLRPVLHSENRENRELAKFPQMSQTGPDAWPAAFETWLGDHAAFRSQWMKLNAALNWKLFGVIDSETTLAGDAGWMFYKNAADSAPLNDYQGINLYTDAQMAQIARDLNALQAALEKKGTRLAVLIPPSKELVYRRYMPKDIPLLQPNGRIHTLKDYLAQHSGVPFVWQEMELREASRSQQLYYKYDTHWNEAGAALAAALMLQQLGLQGPAPQTLKYEPSDTPPLTDLANLSATWELIEPDSAWRAANYLPNVQVELTGEDEQGAYHAYRAKNAPNAEKMLMFCDSFGEQLRQPLSRSFAESSFVHINAFDEHTLAKEQPGLFVLEITQRYADRLLDYLPRLVRWASAAPAPHPGVSK